MGPISRNQILNSETILSRHVSRFSPQEAELSPLQKEVDQLTQFTLKEATRGSMLLGMLGAGWAFRMSRVGVMSLGAFSKGGVALPQLVRAGSYGIGLASESAAFAGIERGIRHFQGERLPHGFKDEWARAAVNLGSLRLLVGMAGPRNVILQHLLTDVGMVSGQHLGAALSLMEKPQGSFAQQMVQAEAMNWSMKAGTVLMASLSPGLFAKERSWDLYLRSQETNLLSRKQEGRFFDPRLSPVANGELPFVLPPPRGPEALKTPKILMMSKKGGNGEDGSGEGPSPSSADSESIVSSIPVPGQLIDGRYRVEDIIGQGGMGVVYRCRHEVLGHKVAMKVLMADLSLDSSLTERFLNEAKAASTIGNPHITDVKDFGTLPDGSTYFIMEYLSGHSLSRLLDAQLPVTPLRIIPIARQIAVGLSAAHRAGIIHRDLKPDNIILTEPGGQKDFVKILDFGVAKMMGSGRPKLTRAGTVYGTAHYMSPEQAMGETLDPRSDIYALGVMMYEMATGRVPFNGGTPHSIMILHVSEPPKPINEVAFLPEPLPQGLEAIIMKSLSKDPKDRYQSMDELIGELDKIQIGEAPKAVVEMKIRSFKSKWRWFAGVAGAGVAATTIALILSARRSGTPSPVPAPPEEVPKTTPPPEPPPVKVKKEVKLTVDPPDAHIFRGEIDLGAGSIQIELKEGENIEVEVRRKGFKSKQIILDSSREERSVQLERLPRQGKPKKPPQKPKNTDPKPPPPPPGLENPWKKK